MDGRTMIERMRSIPVDRLHPFHKNPRRGNVEAIAESLKATGQYRPIVVNRGTLTGRPDEVLAGNHTLAAARVLGWDAVEAVEVDVDDETARRIVLADNRTADLGGYDSAVLADLLEGVDTLAGTGYTQADLSAILRGLTTPVHLTDVDDVPDRPDAAVSRPGDVWQLGTSTLVVSSSADTAAVVAAAAGRIADCVWTDPPYGVGYVGGNHYKTPKERRAAGGLSISGDDTYAEAGVVWSAALPTVLEVARPGAPMYVAHPEFGRDVFLAPMLAAGIRVRQTLLWVKDSFVLGRADYHYRTEPVFETVLPDPEDASDFQSIAYGFLPGGEGKLGRGGPSWYGDNRASNVFECPRPKASKLHPTMKPTALVEAMIRNSCPAGGLVFDPFAGSGTTLIAAHGLQMSALLCEIDPGYADVICRRFEEHTGIVPVRRGKPVTFVSAS